MAVERVDPYAVLTERELQCLRGVAQHQRSSEIAHNIGLSPGTVDNYLSKAAKKLGVSDRDSAARLLLDHDARADGKSHMSFPPFDSGGPDLLPGSSRRLPWPFPTRRRPSNDLTFVEKLIAITVLALAMMMVAGFYLLSISLFNRSI